MSSRTSVHTSTENAVTFVQNNLFRGFVTIANEADADLDWLFDNRDHLERAISTWLADQALSKLKVEIRDADGRTLEQYVFDVSYDGDRGYVEFPVEDVCAEVGSYAHVDGAYLHVVTVTYPSKRSHDFGFTFSDEERRETSQISSFGAGRIGVDVKKATTGGGSATGSGEYGAGDFFLGIATLLVSGAGLGLVFGTGVVLVGASFELLGLLFGTNGGVGVVVDLFELGSLSLLPILLLGWYVETFEKLGILVAVPAVTFVIASELFVPLSFVRPFGLVQYPMWMAYLFVGLVALAELGEEG